MTGLGACLLGNDTPFTGQALDMFNDRVAGKSWKSIGEKYDLSPSQARSQFKKLTGITDHKITGKQLEDLVKGGIDPKLLEPKVVVQKQHIPLDKDQQKAAKAYINKKYPDLLDKLLAEGDQDAFDWLSGVGDDDLFFNTNTKVNFMLKKNDLPNMTQQFNKMEIGKPKPTLLTKAQVEDLHKFVTDSWGADYFDISNPVLHEDLWKFENGLLTDQDKIKDLFDHYGLPSPETKFTEYGLGHSPDISKPPGLNPTEPFKPKVTDVIPDKPRLNYMNEIGYNKEQDIIRLSKEGKTYQQITQATGSPIQDIDATVWNEAKKTTNGDAWKAHQLKPTSRDGIKELTNTVHDLYPQYTTKAISESMGMPQDVVDKIIRGTWKPSPYDQPLSGSIHYTPPPPKPHVSLKMKGEKEYKYLEAGDKTIPPPPGQFLSHSIYHDPQFPMLDNQAMESLSPTGHLPSTVQSKIRSYTGSGSGTYNGHLRGYGSSYGDKEIVEKAIQAIDKGMEPIDRPMTVTRGMSRSGLGEGRITGEEVDKLAGRVLKDDGFMSCSNSPGGVFNNEVRLVIRCPAGTRGKYVRPISSHQHENEFILARGTRYLVERVESQGGSKWTIYVRVISSVY